jgi:cobalt-zinc-cadmium efflux system outer membrane protein
MPRRWVASIVSLGALVSPAAPATAEAVLRLSRDEAVARALERSPVIVRADRERDLAAAARVGAGVLLPANPVASGFAGGRRDQSGSMPPATGPEWGVRLEQMVEIAGQRGARLREAERGVAVAEARRHLARVDTQAVVRSAYVALQVARAQVEAARKRVQLGDQLLRAAEARVRAGASSDVELHLAEVERGRFEHERVEAELLAGDAERGLKLLIGAPESMSLETTTPLGEPDAGGGDIGALVQAAAELRAERKVIGAAKGHIDAAITRLKREAAPNPTLFVDVAGQQPGQLYVGGGVALPLPLWRRNQGELAHARAERRRLDDEDRLLSREIALEVATAVRTLEARHAEARLWTDKILPSAEANVELVQRGWLGGKFDLFRVVQVAREAADARRRQLEVLGELWRARIELDRVTGRTS